MKKQYARKTGGLNTAGRETKRNKKTKNCPACYQVVTRRTNDKCPNCGVTLYLADGEYFLIELPHQRLILHNWHKSVAELAGLNAQTIETESIKDYLPSSENVSPLFLKNEAWAAGKILQQCGKDFELCISVIDLYHERMTGRAASISLYYIAAYPGLKALIEGARRALYKEKINRAVQFASTSDEFAKQQKFGTLYGERDDNLSS
jgi:hypothetical protein